ncbi:ribonuclease HII [Halorhodospira halochloris]|nr:ribonuclease HII [Halorhodospira halochloris]MBK1651189.1 ribonuclease HII [Halorhodospira halochloris]
MSAPVAGVDEAGRGPWAGPVVAAAVILEHPVPGVTDSKRLTAKVREHLAGVIRDSALAWALGRAEVAEVDQLNVRQATLLAMRRALQALNLSPGGVLIDGKDLPAELKWPARAVVGGDSSEPAIAAASILAKTARDREMVDWDREYPQYGFAGHKGYGTAGHRRALEKWGPSPLHRRSFAPVRRLLAATK